MSLPNQKQITICLVMIVKNESKVIKRCLDSCINYIDTYCICDTGSTDNTTEIISEYFENKNITGKLITHHWKNFGYNRTYTISNAANMADYLLLLDADFILKVTNKNFKCKQFLYDSYLIKYDGNIDYRQPLFVKSSLNWKYIGVTHEYLSTDAHYNISKLNDFTIVHIGDGANKTNKFLRDIELFEQGLIDEPENMRYFFYKAQSHKDYASTINNKLHNMQQIFQLNYKDVADDDQKKITIKNDIQLLQDEINHHFNNAIINYKHRLQNNSFPEEIYYSKYMLGYCHQNLNSDSHIYLGYYLDAYSYRPSRLESIYQIIKYNNCNKNYKVSFQLGYSLIDHPYPSDDLLFIDKAVHTYLLKHEIAIASYYIGNIQQSFEIFDKLLKIDDISENHKMSITKQYENIKQKLDLTLSIKDNPQQKRILFFTYNNTNTGGSEITFHNLMKHFSDRYHCFITRDYRDIQIYKPHLIFCQQFAIEKGVQLAKEMNIPCIVTQHGVQQWAYARKNNYFIFNSQTIADSEIPKINVPFWDIVWPIIRGNKINRNDDNNYITFIGRPVKEKGIDIFLDLAKKFPNEKFLIVGGQLQSNKNIHDNIIVQDFTDNLHPFLSNTKLLLFPSLMESFGRISIEASRYGIPLITSDLPAIREATFNKACYVTKKEDWSKIVNEFLHKNLDQEIENSYQIYDDYLTKSELQLNILDCNVNHLLSGKLPSIYTHKLKFTIIITVYNRSNLVINAIKSVVRQTYHDWEIVVVDDCSTDDTYIVIENWIKENIYEVKLIKNETNMGTYYSRNVGISNSSGDYLIHLDSDDILLIDTLNILWNHIIEKQSNVIHYKFRRGNKESWGHFCINRLYLTKYIGYYDMVRYGADTEYMCRIKNFHKNTNIDKVLYLASNTSDSLTKNINPDWANQYVQNFMKWHQNNGKWIDFNTNERMFDLPTVDMLLSLSL